MKLPELEGVVLLNINSWSAGCTMWSESDPQDNFGPASMSDKVLEVVGLYSFLHVGRIQVHMANPIRLGQAREVKVHTPVKGGEGCWQEYRLYFMVMCNRL